MQDVSEQVTQEMDAVGAGGDSLAARMKRRGRELASQRTEIFEIPGWAAILAVELRLLGFDESDKITARLEKTVRHPGLRKLYFAVDQIVAATEGFYEVDGDRRTPVDRTWVDLARDGADHKLPEDLTPRQAVISLVGDRRVVTGLYGEFEAWMSGERETVEEEVVSDFGTTG